MKSKLILIIMLIISLIVLSNSNIKTDSYGIGIAGGAAHVFKSIGYLQAFYEAGFVPEEFVGTSMGSIVAFYLAAGYEPKEIYYLFKLIDFEELFEISIPINGGFIYYDKFIDLIRFSTGIEDFDDFVFPVKFGVANLSYFSQDYWSSGNALEALKASIALEVFFEPFYKDGFYYADIGVSDLYIRNPQELFNTDKYFLFRVNPKLNYDNKRNFKNIINVLYAIVDIGVYYTNALYSEQYLNYDYIFEVEILDNLDPKTFYNSIHLYEEGYLEGKKYIKENNIFVDNNILKKTYDFKTFDYEQIYVSLKTENYFSPRRFYYTLKFNPYFNDYLFDFYIYFEYLNNRLDLGYKLDKDFSFTPFLRYKLFYFPFRFNRLEINYNFRKSYNLNLRTFLSEKFRQILFFDLGYNFNLEYDYYNFNLVYDNTFITNGDYTGYEVKINNFFREDKHDFDLSIKKLSRLNNFFLDNQIGLSINNNFFNLYENIIRENYNYKIYSVNNIKYNILNNFDLEFSQLIFLNDLFLNLEMNFFKDDFNKLLFSCGIGLEFPISLFGITRLDAKLGLNFNENLSFYLKLND